MIKKILEKINCKEIFRVETSAFKRLFFQKKIDFLDIYFEYTFFKNKNKEYLIIFARSLEFINFKKNFIKNIDSHYYIYDDLDISKLFFTIFSISNDKLNFKKNNYNPNNLNFLLKLNSINEIYYLLYESKFGFLFFKRKDILTFSYLSLKKGLSPKQIYENFNKFNIDNSEYKVDLNFFTKLLTDFTKSR